MTKYKKGTLDRVIHVAGLVFPVRTVYIYAAIYVIFSINCSLICCRIWWMRPSSRALRKAPAAEWSISCAPDSHRSPGPRYARQLEHMR